jgi:hypothetical protein
VADFVALPDRHYPRAKIKWVEVELSDLLDVYNEIVVALRADNDEITRQYFDPEFVVYEDPGMPYGGVLHGPDAFITLRRKVRKFWDLAFIAKCIEPNGDKLVAVFNATGVPGSAVDGLETVVTVVWTFRGAKAVEARVLYYDTPRLSSALVKG